MYELANVSYRAPNLETSTASRSLLIHSRSGIAFVEDMAEVKRVERVCGVVYFVMVRVATRGRAALS